MATSYISRRPRSSRIGSLFRHLSWAALGAGVLWSAPASAQSGDPQPNSSRPFEISDNSFLVEEALNQEPGVFQNIFGLHHTGKGEWESAFTQEWPLLTRAHQISYTIPYAATGGAKGLGDAFVHYRVQLLDGAGLAFSPRVSLIVPSARGPGGLGHGRAGWEMNLPFSTQVRDVYAHWNVGFTHIPSRSSGEEPGGLTPRVAASGIWRARPMLNLMLEALVEWEEPPLNPGAGRTAALTLVPGFRTGVNLGDTQTIVGLGVPVTFAHERTDGGVFVYLSYELPFSRR